MCIRDRYYTVEFLRSVHFGGNFDYAEVYDWLEDFKHLNTRELGVYRQASRFLERRHRSARSVKKTTTEPYHHTEDAVILKYYQPGMNADHRRWILEGCPGRSWDAIRRRARQLCNERIDEGVTDRSQLPHLRVTEDMLKRLRRAAALKAQAARREKKHESVSETDSSTD